MYEQPVQTQFAVKKERDKAKLWIKNTLNLEYSAVGGSRVRNELWDGRECFQWHTTFTHIETGKTFHVTFYAGLAHVARKNNDKVISSGPRGGAFIHEPLPYPPNPLAVLSCVYRDDTQGESFESWCHELGYNTDSRKALDMYLQCQKQTDDFERAFPDIDLAAHEEITQY